MSLVKNQQLSRTLTLAHSLSATVVITLGLALPTHAQTETISLLPSLTTYSNLIPGPSGKFYGVTNDGSLAHCDLGCGTVFELSPASGGTWKQTTLHIFTGPDGVWPSAGLVLDSAGNIYGTTYYGGSTFGSGCLGSGCGVVFKLSFTGNGWVETVLHNFTGGNDGSNPTVLALGASSTLLGITSFGGSAAQCSTGCGVVFQLSPDSTGAWHETRLLAFAGGASGQKPLGLLLDSSGNIFGTAGGGNNTCYPGYCGLVFKLFHSSTGWKESVPYRFHGSDGALPNASLIFDSTGNIYGSTSEGGNGCNTLTGCGTIFRLSPKNGVWNQSVLHNFRDQADGYAPVDGLVFDGKGNLYGGTQFGNNILGCNPFKIGACGQIFKLTPHSAGWGITAEYAAPGFVTPVGDLLVDASGTIFGSACDELYFSGGAVFELVP
jgi:uncharacterized repeat protein (TIGR03803 family)